MPKRKRLDFTKEEAATLTELLTKYQEILSGEGEDEKLSSALGKAINKLKAVKHVSFSDATPMSLEEANIDMGKLEISHSKEDEARTLGSEVAGTDALTLEETKKNIACARKHVLFETEAGSRILINILLMHAASNLRSPTIGAVIVPEFRLPETSLEPGGVTYSGTADFLTVSGETRTINSVVESPKLAFANHKIVKSLSCGVYYEAREDFKAINALPQAVLAAAVQSHTFGLPTLRGCATTGEEWVFFVYNKNIRGPGGKVSWLSSIRLGRDLSGLHLVLGLLHDWVKFHDNHHRHSTLAELQIENGREQKMRFCTYTDIPEDDGGTSGNASNFGRFGSRKLTKPDLLNNVKQESTHAPIWSPSYIP